MGILPKSTRNKVAKHLRENYQSPEAQGSEFTTILIGLPISDWRERPHESEECDACGLLSPHWHPGGRNVHHEPAPA